MPEEKKIDMVEELEIKDEEHHYRQKEICPTCSGIECIIAPQQRYIHVVDNIPCPTCQKDEG